MTIKKTSGYTTLQLSHGCHYNCVHSLRATAKQKPLFIALKNFGLSHKLINLIMMTPARTKGKVKVDGDRLKEFGVKKGAKIGRYFVNFLFILVLKKVMSGVDTVNLTVTKFNRLIEWLDYTSGIELIACRLTGREKEWEEWKVMMKTGLRINKD